MILGHKGRKNIETAQWPGMKKARDEPVRATTGREQKNDRFGFVGFFPYIYGRL
jgi:hypothetical protein